MKKLTVILILILTTMQFGLAQNSNIEIGIRLAPVFIFNRVSGDGSINDVNLDFSNNGSKLGILFGPTFDIPFKDDQYYISTGIFLLSKPVSLKAAYELGSEIQNYNTQYIQVPVTFKLFTGEVMSGGRVYFQLGGNADLQVSRKPKRENYELGEAFSKATPLDLGLLLGSGFEYKIGNNKLFAGLTYVRGLIDAAADVDGLNIKNDMLCIDLGFKF